MHLLFAEALPNPNNYASIGWVLVILFCLVGGVNQVMRLVDRATGRKNEVSPTPLPVRLVEELHRQFAAKDAFDQHMAENKREHEGLHSKIGGVDRGAGAKISAEVTAIHTRINSIEKSVGGLEATTEIQNQMLARMDSKLDRIAEKS